MLQRLARSQGCYHPCTALFCAFQQDHTSAEQTCDSVYLV